MIDLTDWVKIEGHPDFPTETQQFGDPWCKNPNSWVQVYRHIRSKGRYYIYVRHLMPNTDSFWYGPTYETFEEAIAIANLFSPPEK